MKKTVAIIIGFLFISTGTFFTLFFHLYHWAEKPFQPGAAEKIHMVYPGQGFKRVAANLRLEGLISDDFRFRIFARLKKSDKNIKAGEYLLSAGMTPLMILEKMVKGKVRLYRLTIPEGYSLKQIAGVVEKAGFATADQFMAQALNKDRLARHHIEGPSLEGYLFPDTYFFPKGTGSSQIIDTMVREMEAIFSPELENRAKEIGFTVHQVLTLASIIEKETGDPAERPLISSVFHNRLKKKMRLESDPTVIYGIKDFDGNIKRKHLLADMPYNTYRIKGLPPGPIASPGKASIMAVLYPAETDYLFFVSKKDTTHQFSSNIKDHNKAVRKYQLRR